MPHERRGKVFQRKKHEAIPAPREKEFAKGEGESSY